MKRLHIYLAAALLSAVSAHGAVNAQIDLNYYKSLHGLSGAELKTAIWKLVGQSSNITMLSYGSGNNHTWWGFYVTDRVASTNEVIDRYSNDKRYFGNRGAAISGMNIEHSFPKSWWGGSETPNAYRDLYNLMPCQSNINSSKSNYSMGVVTSPTTNNGCTKVGAGSVGDFNLWEPADQWKGDFARGYMYMASAYQDLTWKSRGLNSLDNNTWPTFQTWAYELYLNWARNDKVNELEVNRNQTVSDIQGNRNPYVDFPNLMEYVWGDSVDIPLDVRTTVKSAPFTGSLPDVPAEDVTIVKYNFDANTCDWTISNVDLGTLKYVWQNVAKYCWKAQAAKGTTGNMTYYATDASIVSPEINLTTCLTAQMDFDHAMKYCSTPEDLLSAEVIDESGNVTKLSVANWPPGTNWNFINSGAIALNDFCGHKIRLAFHYTSRAEDGYCPTWEISALKVTGTRRSSSVTLPQLDPENSSAYPAEYYSIDGRRVNPDTFRGIVIRRQGTLIQKLLLK